MRKRYMNKMQNINGKFTKKMQKKLAVLFVLVLLAFVGLSAKIIYINAEKGETYTRQILSQQSYDSTTIPFERGDIYDANMLQLATSTKVYNVILDTKILGGSGRSGDDTADVQADITATLNALSQCFGVDESTIRQYINDNPDSQYYRVARQQDYDSVAAFEELQSATATTSDDSVTVQGNILGIWFEEEYKRYYPNGSLASDAIGFSTSDNVGMYGLEEYYNDVLNGTNGREYGYLNSNSILERTTIAAVDGNSIVTSIDINIQKIVEKYILEFNEEHKGEYREDELGSTNTGVIVMDPNTGEILAMASYPNYDLNNPYDLSAYYTEEEIGAMDETATYEALNQIWRNFCISDTYEPGSTAKLMTVAIGLEYGKLTGNEVYNCTGSYTVSGHPDPISCVNVYGHGELTISQSIEQSCNVALMYMVMAEGTDVFMEGLDNFNIGLKTNIDLQGEARTDSLVFDADTMVPTDLAIASFGQGYNTTMIQMAAAFSSLINGGYYYEPHVVTKIINDSGSTLENIEPRLLKQTISAETSTQIIEYCDATVAQGTGAAACPEGYTMGGKTGTAEKYPRGTGDYVVSFMGYAPAENPEVLIYVVIDEPNVADQPHSTYAMEVCNKIMTEVLPYLNVFPEEVEVEEESDTATNSTETTTESTTETTTETTTDTTTETTTEEETIQE